MNEECSIFGYRGYEKNTAISPADQGDFCQAFQKDVLCILGSLIASYKGGQLRDLVLVDNISFTLLTENCHREVWLELGKQKVL